MNGKTHQYFSTAVSQPIQNVRISKKKKKKKKKPNHDDNKRITEIDHFPDHQATTKKRFADASIANHHHTPDTYIDQS
jgi:hypothetical protein